MKQNMRMCQWCVLLVIIVVVCVVCIVVRKYGNEMHLTNQFFFGSLFIKYHHNLISTKKKGVSSSHFICSHNKITKGKRCKWDKCNKNARQKPSSVFFSSFLFHFCSRPRTGHSISVSCSLLLYQFFFFCLDEAIATTKQMNCISKMIQNLLSSSVYFWFSSFGLIARAKPRKN